MAKSTQTASSSSAWLAVLAALVVGLLAFGVSFYRHHHHPPTCTSPPLKPPILFFFYFEFSLNLSKLGKIN
jgi:hypothetical protein